MLPPTNSRPARRGCSGSLHHNIFFISLIQISMRLSMCPKRPNFTSGPPWHVLHLWVLAESQPSGPCTAYGIALCVLQSCHSLCSPDVILDDVAAQPVGEVQELVVEGDEDVCDEGRQLWQYPALHLGPLLPYHNARLPLPIIPLDSSDAH